MFTVVTFPFLFGIMFGDIGHGFVLFLVGSFMCLFSEKFKAMGPTMEAILSMRYILVLMGIFATFAGLIYNDLMAIPLWLWDSCYDLKDIPIPPGHSASHGHGIPMKATLKEDCVYPVGIDPAWHLGSNELAFMNSLKMKLSVILGVL